MAKKSIKLEELNKLFSEYEIKPEFLEGADDFIFEIKKKATSVMDYRNEAYTRHLLVDIIMIAFFAMLAGSDEWAKMEIFAKEKETWLRKYLELPYGVPTDDTIRLVISNIDSTHFYSLLTEMLIDIINKMFSMDRIGPEDFEPDIISVDGKESRGSKRADSGSGHCCV